MTKHFFTSVLFTMLLAATTSEAACLTSGKTLFTCTASKSGKIIEVCDHGDTIRYSFGKAGAQPELLLSVPRADASTYQWGGIGRNMTYSVNIPNGETEYRVFSGTDKDPSEPKSAGVNVYKGENLLATVECVPTTVQDDLIGLNLKRAEEW